MTIEIIDELRGKDAAELKDNAMPEELRGKRPDELEAFVEVLDAHLRSIHQTDEGELREKTPDEEKAFQYGLAVRKIAIAKLEEHRNIAEIFRRKPAAVQTALSNIKYGQDDPLADVRRLTPTEARERALRRLDDRSSTSHMSADQKTEVERALRKDSDIARRILVTENEDYRNAWMKLVTNPNAHMVLNNEERDAIRAYEEYRAMAEWTTTSGGFGIPVNQAA